MISSMTKQQQQPPGVVVVTGHLVATATSFGIGIYTPQASHRAATHQNPLSWFARAPACVCGVCDGCSGGDRGDE